MTNSLKLSELESDLLAELFNIGVGRAAASLSTMVNQEVKLSVPHVQFLTLEHLASKLGKNRKISCVSQKIDGTFSAESLLLFPEKGSLEIVKLMLGGQLPDEMIAELQEEAFSEVGNIVLNACIGAMSESMNDNFDVEIPKFEVNTPTELLHTKDSDDLVLFIHIDLTLSQSDVTGYLAFLLSSISLKKLHHTLKRIISGI